LRAGRRRSERAPRRQPPQGRNSLSKEDAARSRRLLALPLLRARCTSRPRTGRGGVDRALCPTSSSAPGAWRIGLTAATRTPSSLRRGKRRAPISVGDDSNVSLHPFSPPSVLSGYLQY